MKPECQSLIVSCSFCYKEFPTQENLNRHVSQSAQCRLISSRPDIASVVHLKPSNSKSSPRIVHIQYGTPKKPNSTSCSQDPVPSSICFSSLYESADESSDSNVCSKPPNRNHQDYFFFYLEKADEQMESLFETNTTLLARIVPSSDTSSSPNGRTRYGSKYDDYILQKVNESESLSILVSEDGYELNKFCPLSIHVRIWIDSIIDIIDADKDRGDEEFCLAPWNIPSSPKLYERYEYLKRTEVWHCLRAHIKIFNIQGDMMLCLDTVPSGVNDLSSLEGENDSYSHVQSPRNEAQNASSVNNLDNATGSDTSLRPESNSQTESIRSIVNSTVLGNNSAYLTQSVPPPYASCLLKQEARARLEHQNGEMFTSRDKAYLDLFSILQKGSIPIHVFDDVQKWALKHAHTLAESGTTTRSTFLRDLRIKVYGYAVGSCALQPSTTTITLGSGTQIQVTKFPFTSSLVSLLLDKDLMKEENLLLNRDDPFSLPPDDTMLGDVNTGNWYKATWRKLCTTPRRDILLNLIGFSDETVTDKFGKQSLHPFLVTLGLFNRATRNLAHAWINLGYIPKLESGTKTKPQDMHDIYKYLMSEIKFLQTQGGFHWDLDIGGRTYPIVFKVAIQFIIGDCEGHDEICGRKKGHSLEMKGLCRDCDCLPSQADNPEHHCEFIKASVLQSASEEDLAERGFHHIQNAFYDLDLGSTEGGIFSATPPEHLHQISGLTDYLFSHFKSILSGSTRNYFDSVMKQIYENFHRQSERNLHSFLPFRAGIFVQTSGLSSREKVARIFALYNILHVPTAFENMATTNRMRKDPDSGRNISIGAIGYPLTVKWMKLLEAMLVFDAWMRSPEHDPIDIRGDIDYNDTTSLSWPWTFNSPCMTSCRKFMHLYKEMVKRTEGTGLKLTKFHQILHHVRNISEHGSLLNVDSGRPESTHKSMTKDPSKKTQKRTALLESQTAIRLSEDILVRDVKSSFCNQEEVDNDNVRNYKSHLGSRFNLEVFPLGRNRFEAHLKWLGKAQETQLESDMCQSLIQRLFFHIGVGGCFHMSSIVSGFTEYRPYDGVIFRAHPDYMIKPWYDWAMIKWSDDDDDDDFVPARLRLFLDFSQATLMSDEEHQDFCRESRLNSRQPASVAFDNEPYPYLDNGKWALIQSAVDDVDNHQVSRNKPSMKMSKRFKLERNFRLVPIECISDVAFCVLHDPTEENEDDLTGYILKPKDEWTNAFPTYFD